MINIVMTESKFIFVSYHPGTSGHFISVLVSLFSNKDFYYKFSPYGAAHEAAWECNKGCLERSDYDTSGVANIQIYNPNSYYPYVVRTHCADFQFIKNKYTDAKIVHISFSPTLVELENIFYNIFYKYWIGETNTETATGSEIFRAIEHWKHHAGKEELPIKLSLSDIKEMLIKETFYFKKSPHIIRIDSPNILDIPFSKIKLGDYSILDDLSTFLSMPINSSVIDAFNEYCTLQSKLIDFINERHSSSNR